MLFFSFSSFGPGGREDFCLVACPNDKIIWQKIPCYATGSRKLVMQGGNGRDSFGHTHKNRHTLTKPTTVLPQYRRKLARNTHASTHVHTHPHTYIQTQNLISRKERSSFSVHDILLRDLFQSPLSQCKVDISNPRAAPAKIPFLPSPPFPTLILNCYKF